jgi:hypothetical protein
VAVVAVLRLSSVAFHLTQSLSQTLAVLRLLPKFQVFELLSSQHQHVD